jgi:hypothetical protein
MRRNWTRTLSGAALLLVGQGVAVVAMRLADDLDPWGPSLKAAEKPVPFLIAVGLMVAGVLLLRRGRDAEPPEPAMTIESPIGAGPEVKTAALVAGGLGFIVYPMIWIATDLPGLRDATDWDSIATSVFAAMIALAPGNVLTHAFLHTQGAGWTLLDWVWGGFNNAAIWAVLAVGTVWGRVRFRPLMWTIPIAVASYWLIILGVRQGWGAGP